MSLRRSFIMFCDSSNIWTLSSLTFWWCRHLGRWDTSHRLIHKLLAECTHRRHTRSGHAHYRAFLHPPYRYLCGSNSHSSRRTIRDYSDKTHSCTHHYLTETTNRFRPYRKIISGRWLWSFSIKEQLTKMKILKIIFSMEHKSRNSEQPTSSSCDTTTVHSDYSCKMILYDSIP